MCVDECGIDDKSKVLMVGDAMGDAMGARESGVDFLGVSYGFGSFEDSGKTVRVVEVVGDCEEIACRIL